MHVCKSERPKTKDLSLSTENGFTLIELSIVIVIIGLIVAGVVGGQTLVEQAKLRNIIADVNKYKVAMNIFKLEYNALPGDFNRAFDYWPSNCAPTPSAANCNGDGGGNLGPTNTNPETVRFWRHMGLAKIIPELYSGTKNGSYTSVGESLIGVDVPAFPVNGSGGYVLHDSHWGIVRPQSLLAIGKRRTGVLPSAPYLIPKNAKSIDDKIDDGHPIQGSMFSSSGDSSGGQCINGTGGENITNATGYVLTNNAIACRTVFLLEK
jgi:prepilin-type N-terminal cleavage/methylation domain-containing protein